MLALYLRDIRLSVRTGGGALTGVLFFLAVIVAVPFSVGPDLNLLARIGPAILWIGALLAGLLGLDRLFQADRDDGSLDLLVMARERHMLTLAVFVKCLAHWTVCMLPLTVPVLIFGVSASYAAVSDPAPFLPPFLILVALTLFFAVIGPLASAVALRGAGD